MSKAILLKLLKVTNSTGSLKKQVLTTLAKQFPETKKAVKKGIARASKADLAT